MCGVRVAAFSRLESDRGGAPTFGPIQMLGTESSSYPVLAAMPNGLVAVWTAGPPGRATIAVKVFPSN